MRHQQERELLWAKHGDDVSSYTKLVWAAQFQQQLAWANYPNPIYTNASLIQKLELKQNTKSFLSIQVSALSTMHRHQEELSKDWRSFLLWSETKVSLPNTEAWAQGIPYTTDKCFPLPWNSYISLNQWHYDFLYSACWDWISSTKPPISYFCFRKV